VELFSLEFHCIAPEKQKLLLPELRIEAVLRSRSRGAEIKFPPGAGAEITNCGFGSSSGSYFLFIKDFN
jgi:hypothetical protein